MTTQINGDTGVSQCQPNSVSQDDLQSGVVGKGSAFRAVNGSNQGVVAGGYVKAALDAEEFDTHSNFAAGRFTPTVAGYYQIAGAIHNNSSGLTAGASAIYKNGAGIATSVITAGGIAIILSVSALVYLNGTTDYVELFGFQTGGTSNIFANGLTFMSGALVRAA